MQVDGELSGTLWFPAYVPHGLAVHESENMKELIQIAHK